MLLRRLPTCTAKTKAVGERPALFDCVYVDAHLTLPRVPEPLPVRLQGFVGSDAHSARLRCEWHVVQDLNGREVLAKMSRQWCIVMPSQPMLSMPCVDVGGVYLWAKDGARLVQYIDEFDETPSPTIYGRCVLQWRRSVQQPSKPFVETFVSSTHLVARTLRSLPNNAKKALRGTAEANVPAIECLQMRAEQCVAVWEAGKTRWRAWCQDQTLLPVVLLHGKTFAPMRTVGLQLLHCHGSVLLFRVCAIPDENTDPHQQVNVSECVQFARTVRDEVWCEWRSTGVGAPPATALSARALLFHGMFELRDDIKAMQQVVQQLLGVCRRFGLPWRNEEHHYTPSGLCQLVKLVCDTPVVCWGGVGYGRDSLAVALFLNARARSNDVHNSVTGVRVLGCEWSERSVSITPCLRRLPNLHRTRYAHTPWQMADRLHHAVTSLGLLCPQRDAPAFACQEMTEHLQALVSAGTLDTSVPFSFFTTSIEGAGCTIVPVMEQLLQHDLQMQLHSMVVLAQTAPAYSPSTLGTALHGVLRASQVAPACIRKSGTSHGMRVAVVDFGSLSRVQRAALLAAFADGE